LIQDEMGAALGVREEELNEVKVGVAGVAV
jgi:hypothetical protein